MPYACIFVPDFPAQAILCAEPELRDYALVVLDGRAPVQRPIAMNEHARRKGVQPDMSKPLLEQCPSLLIRPRSQPLETAAHQALLQTGKTYSPRVEAVSSDTLMLDLAGMDKLFGRPEQLAGELSRRLKELGLAARIAVASNRDAALAAARGKAGITVIPPGREAEVLGPLPLAALDAPAEILDTLERWGIRDFSGLAALPTGELSERLGQTGVELQALARGKSVHPLIGAEPQPEFLEQMELEYPVQELEPLAFILNRLLGDLCRRLNAYSAAASQIDLHLDLDVAPGLSPTPAALKGGAGNFYISCSDHPVRELTDIPSSSEEGSRQQAPLLIQEGPRGSAGVVTSLQSLVPQNVQTRDAALKGGAAAYEQTPQPVILSEAKNPCVSQTRYEKSIHLPVPTRDPKLLLNLLRLQLETDPPSAPILKVVLQALPASPRVAQGGLFVPLAPDPEKFEITLARIAGLVGQQNVGSPRLIDSHRPGTFAMRPFTFASVAPGFSPACAALKSGATTAADPQNQTDAERIALRIYRPPASASVGLRNDTPDHLSFRGVRGPVVAAGGPWRTSGCWWQSEAWNYDEWDVEIATAGSGLAGFYRIYFDLATRKWFVRGEYD